jgi:hypothetical protein
MGERAGIKVQKSRLGKTDSQMRTAVLSLKSRFR